MGLMVGVAFSLLTVIMEAFITPALRMQNIQADIYRADGVYATSEMSMAHIRIIRFESPLFFANLDRFKNSLMEASGIDLKAAKEKQQMVAVVQKNGSAENEADAENIRLNMDGNFNDTKTDVTVLILDCSAISYIDLQGLNALTQLQTDFKIAGIKVILAGCPEKMLKKLDKMGLLESNSDSVFLSVHDAVLHFS